MSTSNKSHEDVFDTVLTSEELVYIGGGEKELCGGNVGANGKKWCVVKEDQCKTVGPKSHCKRKVLSIKLALYVCMPGVEKLKSMRTVSLLCPRRSSPLIS